MRRHAPPYDPDVARRHLMKSEPVMRGIVKQVGRFDLEVRGSR